ncbi:hypothetical protein FF011L_18420 [Roseimaritima multifibrata]|uniref:Uncharacterized protein n=1 Tax=Roseimaritima multifibrata TaxID=1930274 RepID=A0A517ME84_9BACT|nr:hypothetical protein [Roseimaritima multifibrata]QDS93087.1 hypothetical protein FF011L_18420 [Roseimaritima multifibrata]
MNSFTPSSMDPRRADSSLENSDPGSLFLQRVQRAATTVLGDSLAGQDVLGLCLDHQRSRQLILQDRTTGVATVAIVGAAGQGKSWLAKQIVRGSAAEKEIPSGNAEDESTRRLIWIGPQPPSDLDQRRERYLHCDSADMHDFGGEYLLVDTPGATDSDQEIADTARRALSMASILIMVTRRDQLRSQTVTVLSELGEGTLIVPIINAVRNSEDAELDADCDALVSRMRSAAPSGTVLAPILIPDFDVQEISPVAASDNALQKLNRLLQPYLDGHLTDDRRRRIRLATADARFRESLRATLGEHLPGLTLAVERLNEEAERLPRDIALSLVGDKESLRAGVRSRLRLTLLTETAAIWFPYRTMLGLLNLTHGAWDRVVLSLSGSLPSLLTAAWTSARNLSQNGAREQDLREGLRRRSSAAVTDRLGPPIARFRDQLKELMHQEGPATNTLLDSDSGTDSQVAYLAGIDSLQEESQQIFEQEIDRHTMRRSTVMILALIGTAIFWFLMSAPIVSLYGEYLAASVETLQGAGGPLERFPRPEFSMLLTSLLLSVLPMAIFAMLVITWAQRNGSVLQAEQMIRDRHDQSIQRLQQQGVLKLRWNDPQLADAEFLLSAGRDNSTSSETD